MQYEYLCPTCDKLTEVNCSIKDTTSTIVCECGAEAPKYFGHERGSSSIPTWFEGNFFALTPGQSAKPQQTWHVPTNPKDRKGYKPPK